MIKTKMTPLQRIIDLLIERV